MLTFHDQTLFEGREFIGLRSFSEDTILAYTSMVGDMNPIHPGIVPGTLIAGGIAGIISELMDFKKVTSKRSVVLKDFAVDRFMYPVRPDQTVMYKVTVASKSIETGEQRGSVELQFTAHVGKRMACTGHCTLLVPV